MNGRTVVVMSTLIGVVAALAAGLVVGMRPASAQRIDPAYSAGTFQVSAGSQNEAWRVNTSTGETFHCTAAQAGVTCRRAEFK